MHVRFELQQQTTYFKMPFQSGVMQWHTLPGKSRTTELKCAETNAAACDGTNKKRGKLRAVCRLRIRVALQKQIADFKVAFVSRVMQRGRAIPEDETTLNLRKQNFST